MVIAASKVSPIWQSPLLPLLFLSSAIAVGFPMVAFMSLINSYSFRKKPDMGVLKHLMSYTPYLLGIYFILKMADFFGRGAQYHMLEPSVQRWAWVMEVGLLFISLLMFTSRKLRENPNWLFLMSTLAVVSMVLNRLNVLNTAYRPPGVDHVYVPSIAEFLFTAGLIATIILIYRFIVIYVPILKKGDDLEPCEKTVEATEELVVESAGGVN